MLKHICGRSSLEICSDDLVSKFTDKMLVLWHRFQKNETPRRPRGFCISLLSLLWSALFSPVLLTSSSLLNPPNQHFKGCLSFLLKVTTINISLSCTPPLDLTFPFSSPSPISACLYTQAASMATPPRRYRAAVPKTNVFFFTRNT